MIFKATTQIKRVLIGYHIIFPIIFSLHFFIKPQNIKEICKSGTNQFFFGFENSPKFHVLFLKH